MDKALCLFVGADAHIDPKLRIYAKRASVLRMLFFNFLVGNQPAMFMKTCATMALVAVPAGLNALFVPERYLAAVQ